MVTGASAGPSTAVPAGIATSVRGCSRTIRTFAWSRSAWLNARARSAARCRTTDAMICGSTSARLRPPTRSRFAS